MTEQEYEQAYQRWSASKKLGTEDLARLAFRQMLEAAAWGNTLSLRLERLERAVVVLERAVNDPYGLMSTTTVQERDAWANIRKILQEPPVAPMRYTVQTSYTEVNDDAGDSGKAGPQVPGD